MVILVPLVSLVLLVLKVKRDRRVLLATQVNMDQPVRTVNLALQAKLVPLVNMDLKVQREKQVLMVQLVVPVPRVHLDTLGLLATLDLKDQQVSKVPMVTQV